MKKKIINVCYVLFAVSLFNWSGVHAQKDSIVKKDSIVNVAFGKIAKKDLLGAVSSVNIAELMKKNYGTNSLGGLQSLVGGYTGNNIWAQTPLILVDGIPRNASDIRLSEIESISVLKDAASVVLYGSTAAKGVVLITTKRGSIQPLKMEFRVNSGINTPKGYPNYLNAADYMTLYNEAYVNDGLPTATKPLAYSQDVIDKTRAKTNPYLYPDIDYFSSDYLKKFYNKSDVTAEISGGNEFARYYTNLGLSYNNSIMNYGDQKKNNDLQFNVRGNVDVNLTKWLSASTSAAAVFSDNYTGRGDFWGTSATFRPNWFNPLVPVDMLDLSNSLNNAYVQNSNHLIDGKYLLGGRSTDLTNAFSDMLAAGYIKNKNRTFLIDMTAKADLGMILKGLSFKNTYSLDYRDFYSEAWQVAYAVYEPTWSTVDGKDVITSLKKYNNDLNTTVESIGSTNYQQTMSFISQFNYNRTFGENHNISAALLGWGYQIQNSSDSDHGSSGYHRLTNVNLGFQASYNFRHKYYVDFSGAEVHSPKLESKNSNAFSPAVSLGWRISEENFFKNTVSFINNLKLTASYANLHQDIDIANYYMYKEIYVNSPSEGWYQWRDANAGGNTSVAKGGSNPGLSFIQREEYRVGLEASVFKNFITMEANYFSQNTNGIVTNGYNSIYPNYFLNNKSDGTIDYSFLPNLNYNNDKRTGMDFALNLNKKIGKIESSLGFVGMFYKSEAVRRDEVYLDAYQNRAGKPLDSNWGYICEGFFQDQTDIDNHARQTFTKVYPGDLKYQDVNGDGVIDNRDQVNLGHNGWAAAPFSFGVNLTLKWKNLTLFAMGTGSTGAIGFKNSSYYWVKGTSKYSDVVWGRWTEATKNTATYPRLTTTDNSNNFQNSTFWMYKTDRFDLARVQLTYDLGENVLRNSFIHALSVYINGDNLLTISGERKLMETNIGSAPQFRFFNLGLKAAF